MTRASWFPMLLAAILTAANALKPVVVDDTAYLLFARHLSRHPGDPYGFDLFWYVAPEPAMGILLPPVLPYWLALGIALFGESIVLLKFWLFPFAWILARAGWVLAVRFAPGRERAITMLLVIGPGALPFFNCMLDLPALGLELAAVAIMWNACEAVGRRRWLVALFAGATAAVAAQTKYTAILTPALFVLCGIATRRGAPAAVAIIVAAALFAGWEGFLVHEYGESHFLRHARENAGNNGVHTSTAFLDAKWPLWDPLVAHLGGTAGLLGLLAWPLLGVRPRWVNGAAGLGVAFILAVCVVPARYAVLVAVDHHDRLTLAMIVFKTLGTLTLLTTAIVITMLLRRRGPLAWFLVGWLLIELAAYFVLTPFPAGRRVIGITAVLVLLIGRACIQRGNDGLIVATCVSSGVILAAMDTWDAHAECWAAREAAVIARAAGDGRMVAFGHWGFQYYCDREGIESVRIGETLHAGDVLIEPLYPDAPGFYRPWHSRSWVKIEPAVLQRIAILEWDDDLAGQTIPNLYGQSLPVVARKHPRVRVAVHRVDRDWVVQRRE